MHYDRLLFIAEWYITVSGHNKGLQPVC